MLENGKIELMQQRRTFGEDGKGLSEALDETDQSGMGLVDHATYYL